MALRANVKTRTIKSRPTAAPNPAQHQVTEEDLFKMGRTKRLMYKSLREAIDSGERPTALEVCKRAGLASTNPWYRALEFDPEFARMVQPYLPMLADPKGKIDGLGETERKLLAVLAMKDNHKLSIREICRLAGWQSHVPWYKAIMNSTFRARVEELGFKPRQTKPKVVSQNLKEWQTKILEVLQPPENRRLPVTNLLELLGWDTWWRWNAAMSDLNFRDQVLSLRGPDLEFTDGELKFLKLLEDKANHNLTAKELSTLAGYPTVGMWNWCIRRERFRKALQRLGYTPKRTAGPTRGRVRLAEDPDEEWAKDIVDLRRLTEDYPKHIQTSRLKLDFSFIVNPKLRRVVKRYFRARLGVLKASTLATRLGSLKPFFQALETKYPGVESFAALTRPMVEEILSRAVWTSKRGQETITDQRRNRMVGNLDGLFKYMMRHGWTEAPSRPLIFDEDRGKRPKTMPRPIPPQILEQLMSNLDRLRPYARNAVAIMRVTGLRTADALLLKEDCIEYDAAGDPRLRWFNHKMNREGRPLPVTHEVAEAVKRQQALVVDVPDHFKERYLFRTEWGVYKYAGFVRDLNILARQVPILGTDGKVYRFQAHQFRHTVGTEMINMGLGIHDVATYLDHQSLEMTRRYAMIYDQTLKDKFKQVVMARNTAGGAALQVLREQLAQGDESELDWVVSNLRRLSLPHGYCLHHAKAPTCPHANACFTAGNGSPCAKLVTTSEFLPVIKQTLIQVEENMEIAREKGWDVYLSGQETQAQGLRQVIRDLERSDRAVIEGGFEAE